MHFTCPPGCLPSFSASKPHTAPARPHPTSLVLPAHCPPRSPSRKLFRYIAGDADTPTAGLPTQSPYARGPIGGDDSVASSLASPSRMLRKIPRAPFKASRACRQHRTACTARHAPLCVSLRCVVPRPHLFARLTLTDPLGRLPPPPPLQVLDAPALADDYYLNLVDWSAQNTLAVGLGTCVYLWSACTSKVTRLVDFGEGGAVCRWARRAWRVPMHWRAGDRWIGAC